MRYTAKLKRDWFTAAAWYCLRPARLSGSPEFSQLNVSSSPAAMSRQAKNDRCGCVWSRLLTCTLCCRIFGWQEWNEVHDITVSAGVDSVKDVVSFLEAHVQQVGCPDLVVQFSTPFRLVICDYLANVLR